MPGPKKQSAEEEFIAYVEQHPEYYEVSQAPVYISILSQIAREAKSAQQLHSAMPQVDAADLELILESLKSLNLVSALCTANKVVYYATDAARKFLEMHRKAKGEFRLT